MNKIIQKQKRNSVLAAVILTLIGLPLVGLYLTVDSYDRETGQIVLLIVGLVVLALAAYFGIRAFSKGDIEKALPGGVAEFELASHDLDEPLFDERVFMMGKEYIVFKKLRLKNAIVNMNKVAWVYKSVTQHRTNGIPTGKTYSLMLYIEGDGRVRNIPMKEQETHRVMEILRDRNEKIIVGYRADWMGIWQNTNTIEDFYQQVLALAEMSHYE